MASGMGKGYRLKPQPVKTAMPAPAASVIISTYNQPQWMRKCVLGYARQDRTDSALVLADGRVRCRDRRNGGVAPPPAAL